ncbi:MAG: Creatinase/prolidase [Thermoanaerobacterales bacterium 50_218]|nr:MAG: Creatinase/prolidase [Thermoanaerobacterales bacterium 50_218]
MKDLQQQRLERFREILAKEGLEAFLVSKPENRRYLSGFTGSSGFLLITPQEAVLLTDGRYEQQACQEAPDCRILIYKGEFLEAFRETCSDLQIRELGFEKDHLTYYMFEQFEKNLAKVKLRPLSGLVEGLRMVKDQEEIRLIQEAAVITCAAFWYLLGVLEEGQSEQEVAAILEFFMRKNRGGPPAFETIVAAGERGALPHGVATDQKLRRGQMVVLDLGARYQGYAADFTRTVCLRRVDRRQREIYELVREAQGRALEVIRPGVTASEVDGAARSFLQEAGYGEFFTHALGHGVGLSVHEEPRLAPGQEVVLEPGMVVTVEPGLYLPGWGGVRIEDTVVVTETGCEVLTPVTKDLLIV